MIATVAATGVGGYIGIPSRVMPGPKTVTKIEQERPRPRPTLAGEVEQVSDEAMAAAAMKGDMQAFGELVTRYQTPVYNLTYRMLGNAQDAEDAAQEAFVRALSKLSSYRPDAKFGTWLLSIAAHRCIDQLRRKQSVSLEDIPDMDWPGREDEEPEAANLDRETRDEVQSLLEVLPPMYRAPLVLRYWYDRSYAEIASLLKVTEATIKTRLFRARQMLAEAQQQRSGRYASVS